MFTPALQSLQHILRGIFRGYLWYNQLKHYFYQVFIGYGLKMGRGFYPGQFFVYKNGESV